MSEDQATPELEVSQSHSWSHTWQEAWQKALMSPSVETFESLANDPSGNSDRALKWILVSTLIATVPTNLLCAPVTAIAAALGIAIYIGIINGIARVLKGSGTYNQLMFVMAAYMAPLGIIRGAVELMDRLIIPIPFLGYVSLLLVLYWLVLAVIAVKATHQFSWLKALTVNFLIPIVFTGVVVPAILVLTQPFVDVGNNFMSALKSRNYAQAYNLCTPELQAKLGSPENLEVALTEGGVQVDSWGWWLKRGIEGAGRRLSANATFANGQTGTVELFLIGTNGVWKISGFNLEVGPKLVTCGFWLR